MRVEKQANPWPWVFLVSGLLFSCLAVPRFWRGQANQGDLVWDTAPEATVEFPGLTDNTGPASPTSQFPGGDLLNFGATSIEEVVAAHAGTSGSYGTSASAEWTTLPLPARSSPQKSLTTPDEVALAAADPVVLAALEGIGQAMAQFSTADLLPRIATEAAELYWTWVEVVQAAKARLAQIPAESGKSTLRMRAPSIGESFSTPQAGEVAHDGWCVPQVLLDQLERLAQQPEAAEWARRTIAQLRALMKPRGLEGVEAQMTLANLGDSTLEAVRMADATSDDPLRVELLRAHWALARRLDRWSVMHEIHVAVRSQNRIASRGSLKSIFASSPDPLAAAPAADETDLSNDLEGYEKSRDPQLGRQIVHKQQALQSSPDTLDRALGDAVEQHYRNANIRVAITAAMLNRLIDEKHSEVTPINDRIAGANIHGMAYTHSQSRVRLEPAEGLWQLQVESQGVVDSNTLANGGPVRFRSRGQTDFRARKSVVVDANGVSMQPADVDALSQNRLMGVTTDYDWVPLVGTFTRDRALAQYRAKQHRARVETESRVAAQASDFMDEETRKAVDEIRNQVRERLTNRLNEHGIDLTPVELTTTEERVTARLRVAGAHQLGAHTPRPRALSDSLASAQVHESALTNLAVTLGLGSQSFTAPELRDKLREQFPQQVEQDPVEARPDTVFHFAEDAVQVHIESGRLELTISLENMQQGGRSMRDIVVHSYYAPVVKGMSVELARDGSLGFEGRLSSADRARLHNIFNSVMPAERHLPLVRLDDPADRRFKGLMVTQLVLEDGWIGLAIGPTAGDRVAERSRSLR